MNRGYYGRIDWFRLPAALMVIAIHTAPFSSWKPALDVLLTYGIGRVAVPFFLMTTGYFVLAPCVKKSAGKKGREKFLHYLKKIMMIYGISIILYLPVMFYARKLPHSAGKLAKMLVFDGTFYHLWYFPAVILGSILVALMLGRFSKGTALTAALLLYMAGLMGDSYYGITSQFPGLSGIYDRIFEISSYTRNGIFYAPVFLMLGVLLTEKKYRCPKRICLCGFLSGLTLLMLESCWTDLFSLQRHNSMYLSLPMVMYFLYQLLLEGREGTLLFYVLHPLVIILVRGAAGVLKLQRMLVENSLVHYGIVCLGTLCLAAGCLYVKERVKACVRKGQSMD